MKLYFLLAIFIANHAFSAGSERVVFAEDKLSVIVPDGWKKSERNTDTTLIGWESPDETTSVFFQKTGYDRSLGMEDILDEIIEEFEVSESIKVKHAANYKSGQVNGVGKKFPAIFSTLDVTLIANPKDFEMEFYLFVFDTGDVQYFIQASSTKPVRDIRKKQIMSLIRSLVAR
ncbi:MAG: hypothetical protein P1U89_05680 [Verrucomicrobiales bacterium]|nr:hypothetical protein [Verrucomicrobiales bacterium]